MQNKTITDQQKQAIELMILSDKSDKEIAEQVGVTPQTICSWKKNDSFHMALQRFRYSIVKTASKRIEHNLDKIVETALDFMMDDDTPPAQRSQMMICMVDRMMGKPSTQAKLEVEHKEETKDDKSELFYEILNNTNGEDHDSRH